MKVLYVEDDTETREALNQFLKRRCGKVVAAKDAETALELFESFEPNIMIVDLLLPGMSGMNFIDRIHSISPGNDIRTVITTTVSEVDTVINSIEKDISAYILKPFDLSDMEEKLESIASKIHALSANKTKHSAYRNDDNKGIISDNIRIDFLKLIKSNSGKGPSKVNVILSPDTIEIIAIDALTPYERTILTNKHNVVLIEQVREIFYKSFRDSLEGILLERSGIEFTLEKVAVNAQKKIDHLTFAANMSEFS
jgi:DNA-binding response OmpR family regulator